MASTFPSILQGSPKGMFNTVHASNQNFGELNPFFVSQFFNELENKWHLIDENGIQHDIDFNMSLTQPLLTNGWSNLRTYYRWTGNKEIALFYYGQSSFLMMIYIGQFHNDSFPPFHSLSTAISNDRSFQVAIGENSFTSSELLLPERFAHFLAKTSHSQVKLSGPLNHVVTCNLVFSYGRHFSVKFGEGWTTFTQLNHIVAGNRLVFKCDGKMEFNNVLIVTLI